MKEIKHSPLPWKTDGEAKPLGRGHLKGGEGASIIAANNAEVCTGGAQDEQGGAVGILTNEDAEFICLAVNQHDKLVDALERLSDAADAYSAYQHDKPNTIAGEKELLDAIGFARQALAQCEEDGK